MIGKVTSTNVCHIWTKGTSSLWGTLCSFGWSSATPSKRGKLIPCKDCQTIAASIAADAAALTEKREE